LNELGVEEDLQAFDECGEEDGGEVTSAGMVKEKGTEESWMLKVKVKDQS